MLSFVTVVFLLAVFFAVVFCFGAVSVAVMRVTLVDSDVDLAGRLDALLFCATLVFLPIKIVCHRRLSRPMIYHCGRNVNIRHGTIEEV